MKSPRIQYDMRRLLALVGMVASAAALARDCPQFAVFVVGTTLAIYIGVKAQRARRRGSMGTAASWAVTWLMAWCIYCLSVYPAQWGYEWLKEPELVRVTLRFVYTPFIFIEMGRTDVAYDVVEWYISSDSPLIFASPTPLGLIALMPFFISFTLFTRWGSLSQET